MIGNSEQVTTTVWGESIFGDGERNLFVARNDLQSMLLDFTMNQLTQCHPQLQAFKETPSQEVES